MLHLLGIKHDSFSVKFQGLDARLTGVEGAKVIEAILSKAHSRRIIRSSPSTEISLAQTDSIRPMFLDSPTRIEIGLAILLCSFAGV